MKKNKLYVTMMHRWGDQNEHAYVLCAGRSKHKAIEVGKAEQKFRGGKYMPQVTEFIPDDPESSKVVFKLKLSPCVER